ncbi:unnamed protein product, partial [Ectocarpus sp. 12 AP-2014]
HREELRSNRKILEPADVSCEAVRFLSEQLKSPLRSSFNDQVSTGDFETYFSGGLFNSTCHPDTPPSGRNNVHGVTFLRRDTDIHPFVLVWHVCLQHVRFHILPTRVSGKIPGENVTITWNKSLSTSCSISVVKNQMLAN